MSTLKRKRPFSGRTARMARGSTPLKRGGKIKPKPRTPIDFARVYHSLERVLFVNCQPCASCGVQITTYDERDFADMQNAHTENGGTGRKGGYKTIIPLCVRLDQTGCHTRQHQHGWSVLPALDTRDKRKAFAAATEALWLAHVAAPSPCIRTTT